MTPATGEISYRSARPRRSGLAIASMVTGIVAAALGVMSVACCVFIFLVPVAAVCAVVSLILGIVALRQIRQSNGDLYGRGMAIAGISCSAGTLLLGAALVVVMSALFWRAASLPAVAPGVPSAPPATMVAPESEPATLPAEAPATTEPI